MENNCIGSWKSSQDGPREPYFLARNRCILFTRQLIGFPTLELLMKQQFWLARPSHYTLGALKPDFFSEGDVSIIQSDIANEDCSIMAIFLGLGEKKMLSLYIYWPRNHKLLRDQNRVIFCEFLRETRATVTFFTDFIQGIERTWKRWPDFFKLVPLPSCLSIAKYTY